MSVPKSVIRFKKGNVVYTSSVDYAAYSIKELTIAALRDVGKLISRRCNDKALETYKALNNKGVRRRVIGRGSPFQYWVLRKELELKVGSGDVDGAGHFGRGQGGFWYGIQQELGTSGQQKHGIMTNTTRENISQIIEIESKYLSALQADEPDITEIVDGDMQGGGE